MTFLDLPKQVQAKVVWNNALMSNTVSFKAQSTSCNVIVLTDFARKDFENKYDEILNFINGFQTSNFLGGVDASLIVVNMSTGTMIGFMSDANITYIEKEMAWLNSIPLDRKPIKIEALTF